MTMILEDQSHTATGPEKALFAEMGTSHYHYLPEETQKELKIIAKTLVTRGKGILAADESTPSMARRLKDIGLENTEENRRLYRQLLFSTEGLGESISGTILFHETLFQNSDVNSNPLTDLLRERKIIPGIKVDKGVVPLYGSEDECTSQGLDDLGPRCEQYKKMGCHFAKWRCVMKIGPHTPSQMAIKQNSDMLARYASICQAYRLVPIVEPEVLQDGSHNLLRCQLETERVLSALFKALNNHQVLLEGTILKINMVTPGQSCRVRASPDEIGEATLVTLRRTVPAAVAGIVFLSGGQSELEATINLDAINRADGLKPWPLSFSFGRALQASVLKAWGGREENVAIAQVELMKLARNNGQAALGRFLCGDEENFLQHQDLFVQNNEY